jgi:predicted ester cyclase
MSKVDLEATYGDYIVCLNNRDWATLARFVHENVHHNGKPLGIDGYRSMLEADYEQIPDLRFEIEILIADPPHVASRLRFDVTPKADFLGLPVNGRRVTFCENVFYEFQDGLIKKVWSVIDKAAVEGQLREIA